MLMKFSCKLKFNDTISIVGNDSSIIAEEIYTINFPENFFNDSNTKNITQYFEELRNNIKSKYINNVKQFLEVDIEQIPVVKS